MANLPNSEMEQRVKIVKRWRSLLLRQRDAMHNYLQNLDLQKSEIENGDSEKLNLRMENEQKILREIVTLEKAVLPFADFAPIKKKDKNNSGINLLETADGPRLAEIGELNASLSKLKIAAEERLKENKLLLKKAMEQNRVELKNLRANPFSAKKSVYDSDNSSGALIDIHL